VADDEALAGIMGLFADVILYGWLTCPSGTLTKSVAGDATAASESYIHRAQLHPELEEHIAQGNHQTA